MTPQNIRLVFNIVFYSLMAIIAVWLLVRMVRKSRSTKLSDPRTPPVLPPELPAESVHSVDPPALPAEPRRPVLEPAPSGPRLLTPEESRAAPRMPEHSSASAPVMTAAYSASRTAPLFQGVGRQSSSNPYQLPALEAEDTPLVSGDDYVFGGATPLLAALLPQTDERKVEVKRELRNAGYYQPHAAQNLSAVRYVAIILPLIFFGLLLLIVPKPLERFVLMGLIGGPLLGWAIPRVYIKGKAADRISQIERAMPDMLDMLNMCVSQGMTVQTALTRVSHDLKDVHPELHRDLQIVTEQAQIGSLPHALENFSRRVDTPEVHSFTSLIIQTERMGTSVSAALADYSDNMRQSLKQRADEKGNRAAFKLLFPTVVCLMPAVYMILLGPSALSLSNFFKRDDRTIQQASQALQRSGQIQGATSNRR